MIPFCIGLMLGLFVGVWAVYFLRRQIWGFDPDQISRQRGLRR